MGSIFNRGTRDRPRYIAAYRDIDGVWRQRVLKGCRTKAEGKQLLAAIEKNVAEGRVGLAPIKPSPLAEPLMEEWAKQLSTKRAPEDRYAMRKHLLPVFGKRTVRELEDVSSVVRWLADMRAKGEAGGPRLGSQRTAFDALSKFCSWAVENGHMKVNPVRQVPRGRRPVAPRTEKPWIDDVAIARKAFHALAARTPVDLIYYVCSTSGCRPAEACGLRLSDLDWLDEGTIRVRYSRLGPLKEDHQNRGQPAKAKWAPAGDDAAAILGPWLAKRRAEGAGAEDLLFVTKRGQPYNRQALWVAWGEARANVSELPVKITFYQAGRHSVASRNLRDGATVDEQSGAFGHGDPSILLRHYNQHVVRHFSPLLRRGLGLVPTGETAVVVPIADAKLSARARR